jgi:hypothetical protein
MILLIPLSTGFEVCPSCFVVLSFKGFHNQLVPLLSFVFCNFLDVVSNGIQDLVDSNVSLLLGLFTLSCDKKRLQRKDISKEYRSLILPRRF